MKDRRKLPELTVEVKEREGECTLEGECVLRWRLTWPECSGGGRGAEAVNRYYRRRSQVWRERWEKVLYIRACLDLVRRREESRPFRIWQAELVTQITWHREGLLSLWQEEREHWGYDRPLVLRTGDTWSLTEGAPSTLASFFHRQKGWKKELLARLEELAAARIAEGESLLDPDCIPRLRRSFDPERFWLSEQGVHIFYPMYLLASGAEGVPEFILPLPD